MREIKFRAWSKEDEMFLDIYSIGFDGEGNAEHVYVFDGDSYSEPPFFMEENKEDELLNLMQYTGLDDKNGVAIYEGDIYRGEDGGLREVVWHLNGFRGLYRFKKTYQGETYLDKTYLKMSQTSDTRWGCEVVGNIYENPELLEVDNE